MVHQRVKPSHREVDHEVEPPSKHFGKRLFKRAKSKNNIKKGEAGRVKPMIYLPPGNWEISVLYLKKAAYDLPNVRFRVEPYDPPSFLGALFLLVCLLFFP